MSSQVPPYIDDLAHRLRTNGLSYQQIADELNRQGIPPPGVGLRWHNSSARNAVKRVNNRSAKPADNNKEEA